MPKNKSFTIVGFTFIYIVKLLSGASTPYLQTEVGALGTVDLVHVLVVSESNLRSPSQKDSFGGLRAADNGVLKC